MTGAKRVLIIEDNPVNMELATDLLDAAGYTVVAAETAEDGIRLATSVGADLVLMDIALPGMDGLTATGLLRADPRTAHIPVVALTAHAMKGDEDKALAAGCVGYITKPINTRSFVRLIAEFGTMHPAGAGADSGTVPARVVGHDPFPQMAARPPAPAPPRPASAEPFDDLIPLPTDGLVHSKPAAPVVPPPPPTPPAVFPVPTTPEPNPFAEGDARTGPAVDEERPTDPSLPNWEEVRSAGSYADALPSPQLPGPTPPSQAVPQQETIPEFSRFVFAPPIAEPTASSDPSQFTSPPFPERMLPSSLTNSPPLEPLSIARPTASLPKLPRAGRRRTPEESQADASAARRNHEAPRVLVVDDDPLNREVLSGTLHQLGCEVQVAESGYEALNVMGDDFDLVLLDVMMPHMDGCQTLRSIREELHFVDVPIIMVTALSSREDRLRAVEAGANDFITKPVDRTELRIRMASLLKMKAAQDALKKHQRDLAEAVKARTADLRKALAELTHAQEFTRQAHLDTMHRLALAAEFRDGASAAAHIRCVGHYCAAIARGLGLPPATIELLLHAAPVHDIGMLGIPEGIALKRPEERTEEEETAYRQHTILGARLLSGSQADLLRAGETIALTHHEAWDGGGFPQGLAGERIPLLGRICAVADAFDGLTAYRYGVEAYTNAQAKEMLAASKGREFDPTVVGAFFARWEEIERFQRQYRRTEAPPPDLRPSGLHAFIPK